MKTHFRRLGLLTVNFGAVWLLLLNGCRNSDRDSGAMTASTPKEAASQLEQAFTAANPEVKKNAETASTALRNGDYEKAVVSLQTIRSGKGITLEQGIAIHTSIVMLETKLINAMETGDESAKRAYELLKRMKRN